MASPPLGILERLGELADLATHLLHGDQIRIHALAVIEPFLLALVTGEHLPLAREHRGDVRVHAGEDAPSHAVPEPIRERVVNGQVAGDRLAPRRGGPVAHALAEGGRHGETSGNDVVFHIVLGRRHEQNLWVDRAHGGADPGERLLLVEDVDVVHETGVMDRADELAGGLGLVASHADDVFLGVDRGAARAVGHVHVVDLIPALLQEEQRAGHHELDIVRVCGEGERRLLACLGHGCLPCSFCRAPRKTLMLFAGGDGRKRFSPTLM